MIGVVVSGVGGRMGNLIVATVKEDPDLVMVGGLAHEGHPCIGMDAGMAAGCGMLGVAVTNNLSELMAGCDVLIDFSVPVFSLKNLEVCGLYRKAIVIGSTGFTAEEMGLVREISRHIPVLLAPNMSVGVNALFRILRDTAKILGDDFEVEIVEAHHRLKKDSPSGTAIRMGEVVAESLGRDYSKTARYHRQGECGERSKKEIGMQTVRGGDIVGDHTVYFIGMGERIEITHRAHSRDMFSHGAVKAAKWLINQEPGLYDMQDVLGLQ